MQAGSISIRWQVVIALVGLVLASTATLGILAYRRERRHIEAGAMRAVRIAAEAHYTTLMQRLTTRHEQAQAAMQAPEQQCRARGDMGAACMERELDQEVITLGARDALLVFRGRPIAVGDGQQLTAITFPDKVLARFFAGPEGGYYVVAAADAQGTTLKVRFNLRWVDWVFHPYELGRSGQTFLTDERGYLVTAPGDGVSEGPIAGRSTKTCLAGASGQALDLDYRGVPVIEGYRFVPEIGGGCLVAEMEAAEAFAPMRELVHSLLLSSAAFALVAIALANVLALLFMRPIARLTVLAQELEAGNFDVRAEPRGPREIRRLARAFDSMALTLRLSYAELRQTRDELDQRVKQRTAQLGEVQAQLEERLKQLQEANKNLEAFNYSVSHDLRSPLRAMETMGSLLAEHLGERLDDRGRDYLERIRGAARQLDELTQDLLDYSQVNREEMCLEPVELRPAVEAVLDQLAPEIQAANATVQLDDCRETVLAHRPALDTVLGNLLRNAIKFVQPGVLPRVRVWCEPRNNFVRISVDDNGIGIAADYQERIFRLFERLHLPEDYPGTGVGLAIVRDAVERMGGRVGVDSEPARGSRFWFELREAV